MTPFQRTGSWQVPLWLLDHGFRWEFTSTTWAQEESHSIHNLTAEKQRSSSELYWVSTNPSKTDFPRRGLMRFIEKRPKQSNRCVSSSKNKPCIAQITSGSSSITSALQVCDLVTYLPEWHFHSTQSSSWPKPGTGFRLQRKKARDTPFTWSVKCVSHSVFWNGKLTERIWTNQAPLNFLCFPLL